MRGAAFRVVTLYTHGILERVQCLQAGFSPEQRIFLRRHAMHASGRRFRSFPALVFISLQAGLSSSFRCSKLDGPLPESSRPLSGPSAGSTVCVLPGSRELAWLWVSKSSRAAAASSWPTSKRTPGVFDGNSSGAGWIMTGADTPGPKPEASFGTVGEKRRRFRNGARGRSGEDQFGVEFEERGRRRGEMEEKVKSAPNMGKRFSGEWWLGK